MVRYLNPVGRNPRRITKADKDFAKRHHFKDIKFPVKIRDIHKLKNVIPLKLALLVFGYENKKKYPIYVSRKCREEIYIDLVLIGEGGEEHYVLINNFNRSIYVHSLHPGRKHFSCYCLHDFITEEISERHIKYCFKINAKLTICYIHKFGRKIILPFMIYEDYVIQNPNESFLITIRDMLLVFMVIN